MVKTLTSLLLLIGLAFSPLPEAPSLDQVPINHEVLLLPKTEVFEAFSMGYRNALAELLWFKLNNYFGKHFRGNRNYPWLNHMCTLILKLNPNPTHTYEFCASMLAYEAKDPNAAIAILGEATKTHPTSWKFWFLRGFFYSYLLKDKEKSAEDYKIVETLPAVPEGIKRVVAERSATTIIELIANLEAVYAVTQNAHIREVIAEKIKRARLTRDLEILKKAKSDFVARAGKSPESIEELLSAGLIPKVPLDPWGAQYYFEKESGEPKSRSDKVPLHFDEF